MKKFIIYIKVFGAMLLLTNLIIKLFEPKHELVDIILMVVIGIWLMYLMIFVIIYYTKKRTEANKAPKFISGISRYAGDDKTKEKRPKNKR